MAGIIPRRLWNYDCHKLGSEWPLHVWIYLLRKGAYRDFLHIILKNTQLATSWYKKYSNRRKGEKVITAKNMCSNFGGFRCSPLNCWKLLSSWPRDRNFLYKRHWSVGQSQKQPPNSSAEIFKIPSSTLTRLINKEEELRSHWCEVFCYGHKPAKKLNRLRKGKVHEVDT